MQINKNEKKGKVLTNQHAVCAVISRMATKMNRNESDTFHSNNNNIKDKKNSAKYVVYEPFEFELESLNEFCTMHTHLIYTWLAPLTHIGYTKTVGGLVCILNYDFLFILQVLNGARSRAYTQHAKDIIL